jgi:predicted protein tyrosine phosphatase
MSIQDHYVSRAANAVNPYQGKYRRVLCVCSAGLLRSATAAWVLSQEPFNFNTRSVGVEETYALIPIDPVLLTWADEVVCMTHEHALRIEALMKEHSIEKQIVILGIPDDFGYRDPTLVRRIKESYDAATRGAL